MITKFVTEFGDKFGAKFVTKLLWAPTSQGKLVGRKQSLKNLLHFNLQWSYAVMGENVSSHSDPLCSLEDGFLFEQVK